MKHSRLSAFVLSLAAAMLLTSCGSSDYAVFDSAKENGYAQSAPGYGGWGASEEAYMEEPYFDGNYDSPAAPTDEALTSGENDLSERKIIMTATLQFETTAYDDFIAEMNACVSRYGGYAESTETHGGGVYSGAYNRSADLTLRVPADRYDDFMSAVSGMGALTYRSESREDVTMSYVDIESHVRALETEYDALLDILSKAESLDDVILLQSRISELNYQMDSYKSQLRKYDDLISYCTVHVYVSEVWRESTPNAKTITFGERIVLGLKDNLADIGEGFENFAVWFVTSLPYLLIWAVVIAAAVLIIRALIKHHKKKKEQKILDAYIRSRENENKDKKTDEST